MEPALRQEIQMGLEEGGSNAGRRRRLFGNVVVDQDDGVRGQAFIGPNHPGVDDSQQHQPREEP